MTVPDTPAPESRPETRSPFGPIVAGVLLLAVGLVWMLSALEVVDLRPAIVLPGLLAVLGAALVVGSFSGRHSGLVGLGVFLTILVVLAAAFPGNPLRGGIGERTYRVTSQADLEESYGVGLGELTLDLRELELTEAARVDLNVGAGEITVILPPEVPVRVDAAAGAGEIDVLGERADGVNVSREFTSPDFDAAGVGLTLDIGVSAGQIQVTR